MSAGRVMGGLARTSKEASRILDASGKQIIIIETVGVGQSELDIAQTHHFSDDIAILGHFEAGRKHKSNSFLLISVFTYNL